MATKHWRARVGGLALSAALLVLAAGCGSGGSKTSSPTGPSGTTSAAQGKQVHGTLTKGPGVAVGRLDEAPGARSRWLAWLTDPFVGTAEAVVMGQPAVGVTVQLVCTGGGTLTTTTNSQGKFEFNGVTGTSCSLSAIVNGATIPLATNIQVGPQPVEVEGVLTLTSTTPATTPGVELQKLEAEVEFDDEDGHHAEHHGGTVSTGSKRGDDRSDDDHGGIASGGHPKTESD